MAGVLLQLYSKESHLIISTDMLGEGVVIKRSSHEIVCHVIMYLNVKLELALVAIHTILSQPTP